MSKVVMAYHFGFRLSIIDSHSKERAINFRNNSLKYYNNTDIWKSPYTPVITIDFEGINHVSPRFAKEVFAYFTQYAEPSLVLGTFRFINIGRVHRMIIEHEIMEGYYR